MVPVNPKAPGAEFIRGWIKADIGEAASREGPDNIKINDLGRAKDSHGDFEYVDLDKHRTGCFEEIAYLSQHGRMFMAILVCRDASRRAQLAPKLKELAGSITWLHLQNGEKKKP